MFGYIYIAVAIAFAGLSFYALEEHHRANANAAVAEQWEQAAKLAQQERDTARTALNERDTSTETKYKQDIEGVRNERDKALARLNALKFDRVPVNPTGCPGNPQQGETVANTSRVTATERSQLSRQDAGLLIAWAAEADEVIVERNIAVSLLLSCRTALEAP